MKLIYSMADMIDCIRDLSAHDRIDLPDVGHVEIFESVMVEALIVASFYNWLLDVSECKNNLYTHINRLVYECLITFAIYDSEDHVIKKPNKIIEVFRPQYSMQGLETIQQDEDLDPEFDTIVASHEHSPVEFNTEDEFEQWCATLTEEIYLIVLEYVLDETPDGIRKLVSKFTKLSNRTGKRDVLIDDEVESINLESKTIIIKWHNVRHTPKVELFA